MDKNLSVKELLDTGLVNKAELARILWPGDKAAPIRLAQKLSETNGQRLLPDEEVRIREILKDYLGTTWKKL